MDYERVKLLKQAIIDGYPPPPEPLDSVLAQRLSMPSVQDYAQDRKRFQNESWPYGSTNETNLGGVQGDPNPATALFPNVDIGLDDVGMFAASVAPITGDAIALNDSLKYGGQADQARQEGRYLDMPGLYAESIASALGAVPLLGGMARALKGGVNKAVGAYRSRLEPALENMPQEKMTADQARGYLSKVKGGVSSDELDYTGINAMLKSGQPVTKTGLLGQYNANPLQINDVYKGGRINTEPLTESEAVRKEYLRDLDIHEGRAMTDAEHQEFRNLAVRSNGGERLGEPTKFSDYTLPGGEDYRELLMTLPGKLSNNDFPIWKVRRPDGHVDSTWTSQEAAQRKASEIGGEIDQVQTQKVKPGYTGFHYDEPNILAHARYNTRTIDGDKTLFIEEIQSDWHQAGRKKGYASESDSATKALQSESDAIINRATINPANGGMTIRPEDLPRYNELQPLIQEGLPMKPNSVPDAPYKSTEKWQSLAFRRTVKEAIDQGHVRIAWTPGAVQADRYDLSQKVGEINYDPTTKQLRVYGKGDDAYSPIMTNTVEPEDLADHIGKEAAERLLASKQKKFTESLEGVGMVEKSHHTIKGKDLKVGGEGMKSFYDKMMVKTANKFGKKYGAKVEVKSMEKLGVNAPHEVWSMKITPEMKKDLIKGGVALGAAGVMLPGGQE